MATAEHSQSPPPHKAANRGLRRFRIALVVGFAAMIGLVVFVTAIGLNSLQALQRQSANTVDNHMAKIEKTTRMRNAARQRIVTMQKMTLIDDPFARDDLAMHLYSLSAQFAEARISLLAMPLNPREQDLLEEQGRRTGKALPIQREIIDLLANDRVHEAQDRLIGDAIPAQDQVLEVLDQIYQLQLDAATRAVEQSRRTYQSTRRWMLALALGAMFIGLAIAGSVVYRSSRSAEEREKHLLEIESMNAALQKSTSDLAAASLEARQASESKSAFLANMSHEIRTPLTAIIGFAETLLEQDMLKARGIDAARIIARNGRHLLHIINEILDLSKIEAGKLELEIVPVSVPGVLAEIRETIELSAREKGLELALDLAFPLPESIDTDPVRLKQILLNICNNAVKFTHKGGLTIGVSVLPEEGRLQFTVSDSGIGMSERQLQRVFDAFTQADASTTRRYGGSGLGLTISKRLSTQLGASLKVESRLGRGSVFTLGLPISAANLSTMKDRFTMQGQERELISAPPVRVRGRVLLVEDSADNQKLISLYLEQAGCEVCLAENGQQAVELALADPPDLILMDIQMPVMDGIEATRLLRRAGCKAFIVALTANAMKEDVQRCEAIGCDGFLPKPVVRAEFNAMLVHFLENCETASPAGQDDWAEQDETFRELVGAFIAGLPQQLGEMKQALGNAAWDELAKAAHKLKGMGGSFGFPELTEIARQLENACRNGDCESARTWLEKLVARSSEIVNEQDLLAADGKA